MEFQAKERYTVSDLISIMALLRGEGGCPWDREQDHQTIRKNLIEEAYEVVEAIDAGDRTMLCEELGDVLFQVMLNSQIANEKGLFSIDDVIGGICEKMVRRHPWVFGGEKINSAEEGEALWARIKMQEKAKKP